MKDWKSLCKRFLFLPLWLVVILTILCAAAITFVFAVLYAEQPILQIDVPLKGIAADITAYVIYAVSFYTVVVLSIACFTSIPAYYKKIKSRVYENTYANRYLTDAAYKTHVTLYTSLAVNLLYVATNAVSAVVYDTHWFAIFAVYYAIMAIMRFMLVRYVGKNHIGQSYLREWKRARACAYILLTVNVILSGVVLMMVYYNRGFEYQGFLIYVMAMYTFYTTTTAIMELVRYRKYHSPVMSVSKVIKLASCLFSMLFLETAMFAQFGQDTPEYAKRIMIMATGAGISAVVVGMSIYLIVRANKTISAYKNQEYR